MSVEGMISEATAVKEAGVSARTLQRFSEAGYLTVQVKGDGERLYSRLQLTEIFGSFQELPPSSAALEAAPESSSCDISSCETDTTNCDTAGEPTQMAERANPSTSESVDTKPSIETTSPNEELQKLRNLVALQERILDMKESEIQDLRSQRDWLKTRVEKLEEKGDRDQVLLLSETQAIRQLIGLQQKRPSAIRSLLEWLGLGNSDNLPALPSNQDIATASASSGTIVVNKAANG
jgi:hypothetical protein